MDTPGDVFHYKVSTLNLTWYMVDASAPTILKDVTAKNAKTSLMIYLGGLQLENKQMLAGVAIAITTLLVVILMLLFSNPKDKSVEEYAMAVYIIPWVLTVNSANHIITKTLRRIFKIRKCVDVSHFLNVAV